MTHPAGAEGGPTLGGMRIEMLGPSGAGKTTTLAAAIDSESARTWLAPKDLAGLLPTVDRNALREAIDRPGRREFANWLITLVDGADLAPSQKVAALMFLRRSCYDVDQIEQLDLPQPVVHDELLLHRAFSLLLHVDDVESAAREYFGRVDLPDAAVVVSADPDAILRRVQGRDRIPNVYRSPGPDRLPALVAAAHQVAEIATSTLTERGVPVLELDTTHAPEEAVAQLVEFIAAQHEPTTQGTIRERLLTASGSFRKKDGRHELRTKDVMYCAFSTPHFTISPAEAQRDATKRVATFGLSREQVEGRTVLDLGSNAGAMLFEISNFAPARGYGIEYDQDKVDLANEIAEFAQIENVRFDQGDIDLLDAEQVGVHDIVFALAIEAHVQQPERLYQLLGQVTGDLLCFEGNATCDMDAVREQLTAAGFADFVDLGFCQDDRDRRNNRRPQLLARKQHRGLFARLRSARR